MRGRRALPKHPCGKGRPRFPEHLYAIFHGYFWLPCPVCQRKFGGHEWARGNVIFDNPSEPHKGSGVCSIECVNDWELEQANQAASANLELYKQELQAFYDYRNMLRTRYEKSN